MYKEKDWLYTQRYLQNRTIESIANECQVSSKTIQHFIKKFEIPKPRLYKEILITVKCSSCERPHDKNLFYLTQRIKKGHTKVFCSRNCADKHHALQVNGKNNPNYNGTWNGPKFSKEQLIELGIKGCLAASTTRGTSIEVKMAKELTHRGIKYEEQVTLGRKFVLDFFLPDYGIVIECDGRYWHTKPGRPEADQRKNNFVSSLGYKIYRFWDDEINKDVAGCVDIVSEEIKRRRCVNGLATT